MCINCVNTFSKGIVVGSNTGEFSLWIKDEDPSRIIMKKEEDFELMQLFSWNTQRNNGVVSIDITRNDEYMACSFDNNDIATFEISKIIPNVPEALEKIRKNLKLIE